MSSPTGKDRIYVMRSDGRDLERLIDLPADTSEPSLSLTAGAVAFESDLHGNEEIYRVNLEGENLQRLTDSLSADRHPSWSPDGKRLVFSSSRWGQPELALVGAEGGEVTRLTWDQMVNVRPVWSPTGDSVAYVSYRGGSADIWVRQLETGESRRLTYNSIQDTTPAWSPDGRRLVYKARHYWGHCLSIVSLDEPDERLDFARDHARARDPVFSPDGRFVLFATPEGMFRSELRDGVPQPALPQPVPTPRFGPLDEFRELEWGRCPLPW